MGTQSTKSSTATPASRWARRKERTHRRLLEAADALFRSQGFDATTVEEIADAADVAKGTFFNYFESKASLLGAILYTRTQPLLDDPPGAGTDAPMRIRMLLEALWDALSPYQPLARRMLAHIVAHSPPEPPPSDVMLPSQALAALVREGQAQGQFRDDIDPDAVGILIVVYFFRLFMRTCDDGTARVCWEQAVDQNLDLLYHGLMRHPS